MALNIYTCDKSNAWTFSDTTDLKKWGCNEVRPK